MFFGPDRPLTFPASVCKNPSPKREIVRIIDGRRRLIMAVCPDREDQLGESPCTCAAGLINRNRR